LLIAYGITASIGDVITTMIGISSGKVVEGNPIARWLFGKIGESATGWLGAVGYCFVSLGMAAWNYKAGLIVAGSVAVTETIMVIKNYLLLKKLGIPVK
jgi:hypothetical protein